MSKHTRSYQAYTEGARACHQGLSMITNVYMDNRYLRSCWLDGWNQTNAFRENNLMKQRGREEQR